MSMENKPELKEESTYPLSDKEAVDLLKKINDERLHADEDVEHFTLHLGDMVRYVPKQSHIFTQHGNVKIEDFLRESLAEEPPAIE